MKDIKEIQDSRRAYVYICYLHNEPIYTGKGTGKRYLHCKSGKSSNPQLNQALFTHGIDALDVRIPYYDLSDDQAIQLERRLIISYIADGYILFNSDIKTLNLPDPSEFFGSPDIENIPDWVLEAS